MEHLLAHAEGIYRLLENAHTWYGIPHMFHEIGHWVISLLVSKYGLKWKVLKRFTHKKH